MRGKRLLHGVLMGAAVLVAALFFTIALQRAQTALSENGIETTRENLRRGAVLCYALEGQYPESLDALLEQSGISVDAKRYAVYYTVFAPNILPEITVVEK